MKWNVYFLSILLLVFARAAGAGAQPFTADSTELQAFMDGLIESHMEREHIAGAVLLITRNGRALLQKGYGYADQEDRVPVDPGRTLFRIGSISKLFVWTAVMQQVERGRLDLNADINEYLTEFDIPDTYPQPITLKHLMTHTPGFEDRVINLFALDSSRVKPLGELLADELPARVRPPGQFASYSNHGTALAAYIVEQVSGQPFVDYVEEQIFTPLGMRKATFRQPVPARLRPDLSNGYAYENGVYVEKPFEYVPLAPAGAASSTAEDLLPFMQAHLNLGQYNGYTLLDSTTARYMHSPAFRHAEQLNPMLYGFIDMSQNGVRIHGHGGDTFWFHSMLALFPDHDLGFFLSFNSENGGGITGDILESFVDRYFPEETLQGDTFSHDRSYLQRFEGAYRSNRHPYTRLTRLMALMNQTTVTVTEDGMLKTMNGQEGELWIPVNTLTFRKQHSSEKMAFQENSSGRITHLYRGDLPVIAFKKISFISSRRLHVSLFLISTLVFLFTLVYWPSAYLIRRSYRSGLLTKTPLPLYVKVSYWVNCLLLVAFCLGMALSITGPEAIVYGISPVIKLLLILPLISLPLTLYTVYLAVQAWKEHMSGIWSRLAVLLLAIAFLGIHWQLYYWNLLGFQY